MKLLQDFSQTLSQQTIVLFQDLLKYLIGLINSEFQKKTDFEFRQKVSEKYYDFFLTIKEFYYQKIQDLITYKDSSDIRDSLEYQLNQLELKFMDK